MTASTPYLGREPDQDNADTWARARANRHRDHVHDVVVVEEPTGKGHYTRVVGNKEWVGIGVTSPDS